MVATQVYKLRDTSDTFVGRTYGLLSFISFTEDRSLCFIVVVAKFGTKMKHTQRLKLCFEFAGCLPPPEKYDKNKNGDLEGQNPELGSQGSRSHVDSTRLQQMF